VYNSNISKLTVANGDVECENFTWFRKRFYSHVTQYSTYRTCLRNFVRQQVC